MFISSSVEAKQRRRTTARDRPRVVSLDVGSKFRNVTENVVSENACVETHAPDWTRDTEHNTRILIKTEQNLMPDSPRVAVGTGFAPRRCGQV